MIEIEYNKDKITNNKMSGQLSCFFMIVCDDM